MCPPKMALALPIGLVKLVQGPFRRMVGFAGARGAPRDPTPKALI